MNKMMTTLIALFCVIVTPATLMARDRYSASGKSSSTPPHFVPAKPFASGKAAAKKSTTLASSSHRLTSIDGVQRDAKGRVERSSTVREKFMMPGHPQGWPGHVVNHSVPLKRDGSDSSPGKRPQTTKPGTK